MVGEEVLELDNKSNGLRESAGKIHTLKRKGNFGRRPHLGMVYFIRAGEHIKIGYSTRPLDRLKALQTSHVGKLEIVGTMSGSKEHERSLHGRFWHHHVRGEWFRGGRDLIEYIERLTPEGRAAAESRAIVPIVEEKPVTPREPDSPELRGARKALIAHARANHENLSVRFRDFLAVEQLENYERGTGDRAMLAKLIAANTAELADLTHS